MLFTFAFCFFLSAVFAWPTFPERHRHYPAHHVRDFVIRSRREASSYPLTFNGTISQHNGTTNGTLQNATSRWLPSAQKVRGVNLGSLFIIEPWMAYDEFNSMGCGDMNDEWSCVTKLGQDAADAVFAQHWNTWITQDDIIQMVDFGLNTIRVPIGWWIKEDEVTENEKYPRGQLQYLDRLMGWASEAGLHVIIDLHAAPGVQYPNQQFTGHGVDTPAFYTNYNYERALKVLEWMALRIQSHQNYKTVGVLQVLNEPVHASDYPEQAANMVESFYPAAYIRIRAAERSLGVPEAQQLKIQYMGNAWGSGDPTSSLPNNTSNLLFDDHRYYKWDPSVEQTKQGYLNAACADQRGGEDLIVGEWSLSINDDYQSTPEFTIGSESSDLETQKLWYRSFWAAQVQAFERGGGWIFWTWKCNWINGQDEWRWCYESAVENGVIPQHASAAVSLSPC